MTTKQCCNNCTLYTVMAEQHEEKVAWYLTLLASTEKPLTRAEFELPLDASLSPQLDFSSFWNRIETLNNTVDNIVHVGVDLA